MLSVEMNLTQTYFYLTLLLISWQLLSICLVSFSTIVFAHRRFIAIELNIIKFGQKKISKLCWLHVPQSCYAVAPDIGNMLELLNDDGAGIVSVNFVWHFRYTSQTAEQKGDIKCFLVMH